MKSLKVEQRRARDNTQDLSMKKFFTSIYLIFAISTFAQVYPQMGARSAGMAGVGLTLNDVYAVYNNPGAFGALEETSVGLNYENRFLLKEISTQALAFGYHSKNNGNFGLQFQQYGFSLYRELQGGLTYGRELFRDFYGGFSLNFHSIQLGENYGSRNSASGSLGIYYEASKTLHFGVRVQNISRTKLADLEDERLPTRFGLGLTYYFSEILLWSLEAEKTIIHPVNVKSALEVHLHEVLYLRLGVNSYPFQSSFGFGIKLNKFQFDMATMWHNTLGISPSAGLKYSFN